jgi:hypothetical protein
VTAKGVHLQRAYSVLHLSLTGRDRTYGVAHGVTAEGVSGSVRCDLLSKSGGPVSKPQGGKATFIAKNILMPGWFRYERKTMLYSTNGVFHDTIFQSQHLMNILIYQGVMRDHQHCNVLVLYKLAEERKQFASVLAV